MGSVYIPYSVECRDLSGTNVEIPGFEQEYAEHKPWLSRDLSGKKETFKYGSYAESKSLDDLLGDEKERRDKQAAIVAAELAKATGVAELKSKVEEKLKSKKHDEKPVIMLPTEIMIGQEPSSFVCDLSNNMYKMGEVFDVKSTDLSGAKLFEHINETMNNLYEDIRVEKTVVKKDEIVGFSNDVTIYASIQKDLNWQISTPTMQRKGVFDVLLGGDAFEDGQSTTTDFKCSGCDKYFATKGSLKRHHERKSSCKEICEKKIEETFTGPYIVEWVETALKKALSGDLDKPYCKYCEIEFANKSNLNKHLSKSVACDKLAKRAFLEFIRS